MLFFNKWGLRGYLSEDIYIYGKNTLEESMAERDVCREHKKRLPTPFLFCSVYKHAHVDVLFRVCLDLC